MQGGKIKCPLKFRPIVKKTMWGVEYWTISAIGGFESIIDGGVFDGYSLRQVMEICGSALLGRKNFECFGKRFPLLVKFIDAQQDLSVQVHPNDSISKERHGCSGKSEMWYVMVASGDAKLMSGFIEPMTEQLYKKMTAKQIVESLMEYKISHGDMFYLPAGTVHSIGAGTYIAEIQQSSDITYRIYDFDRKDENGNYRELHTDLATEAIDFSRNRDCKVEYLPVPSESDNAWDHSFKAVECPHFTTSLIKLENKDSNGESSFLFDYSSEESFAIITCVGGEVTLIYKEENAEIGNNSVKISAGEAVLLPADLGSVTFMVAPDSFCELLETHI